jgi:Holliday junction resolvasome RuvABC endonuclease subunit
VTALFDTIPGLMPPRRLVATPAAADAPRIIGLDLSIKRTGIARIDGTTQAIACRGDDGDRRLLQIRTALRDVLSTDTPDLAVIEDLPRDSHAAKIVGFVHGIVRAELADCRVPYALITGATLKSYACDNGRAEKADMASAAYLAAGAEFPRDKGGDECDAWWLRAAGLDHYGHPLFSLPQAQRDRLHKVAWPQVVA